MNYIWLTFPTILYASFAFIRLNFTEVRSWVSSKDVYRFSNIHSQQPHSELFNLIFNTLAVISLVFGCFLQFGISALIIIEPVKVVYLTSLAFWVMSRVVPKNQLNSSVFIMFFLTLFLMLSSQNLYQLYILIEISAYLNMYLLSLQSNSQKLNKNYQNVVALLITFVLNFLTSAALFSVMLYMNWFFEYLTWTNLVFSMNPISSSILAIALLLKLGAGPWLSGNIHSYSGYSFVYLLIYTLGMVLVLTPILLSLLQMTGSGLCVFVSIALTLLYLLQVTPTLNSLKSLFAASTVIVYTYLLLITTI